jgi:ribonuclease HI
MMLNIIPHNTTRRKTKMHVVTLHADGACRGNGNIDAIGGIGVVLIGQGSYPRPVREISLVIPSNTSLPVTNQRAELLAVITGLQALKKPCKLTVCSDSQYVICGMRDKWDLTANLDLWNILIQSCGRHSIEWVWVRGHGKDTYNQRCDILASEAIKENYVLPKHRVYKLCEVQNENRSSLHYTSNMGE